MDLSHNKKAEASAKEAGGSNPKVKKKCVKAALYQPSCDFNLSDPYCRLMDNSYKSLHDPHLKSYYNRKDMLKKLKKDGYITSNNKVVCKLKELNKYRHYLTGLKLDFEKNYIREQKILEKQINSCYKLKKPYGTDEQQLFQDWLLEEKSHVNPEILRHRYIDMISTDLRKKDKNEIKPGASYKKEEKNQYQEKDQYLENIKRQIYLHKEIEEDWKVKEMLLLSKIGKEVQREERLERQRQQAREEANWKKQLLLEKKVAYHLQKMQKTTFNKEESLPKITLEKKPLTTVEGSVHLSESYAKELEKKSTFSVLPDMYEEKSITPSSSDEGNRHFPSYVEIRNIYEKTLDDTIKHQVPSDHLSRKRSKKLSFNLDSAHTHQTSQHPLVKHLSSQQLSRGHENVSLNFSIIGSLLRSIEKHTTVLMCFKTFKIANRNSFQDINGQNISKAELLKDVRSKKHLIAMPRARNISQDIFGHWRVNSSSDEEEIVLKKVVNSSSDEEEIVLKEVVKELPKLQSEDKVNRNSLETLATPLMNRDNQRTRWFLRKSGHPSSRQTATLLEPSSALWRQSQEEQTIRVISATDLDTSSTDLDFYTRKRSQQNDKFMKSDTEPTYWLGHEVMTSSSPKEENLTSSPRDTDDPPSDTTAKITDGLECQDMENSLTEKEVVPNQNFHDVKGVSHSQHENTLACVHSSQDNISGTPPPALDNSMLRELTRHHQKPI